MPPRSLCLGSASPRRLQLLAQIGVVPDAVTPADIDESRRKDEAPRRYVERMAQEKAEKVFDLCSEDLVLAADTAVFAGRRLLDKPADAAEAEAALRLLSGRRHRVATAVAVIRREDGRRWLKLAETQVKFKRLDEAEIRAYIASGEWRGKAGSYGVQGAAEMFVSWLSGSYSAVVGLPLRETAGILTAAGRPPLLCPET